MASKQILLSDMVDDTAIDQIPESIQQFYNQVSQSMLKQIKKRGIRKFSGSHVDRWLRIQFPINEDQLIVEKNKLAASQVSKYLLRNTTDYKIPLIEVRQLLELDKQLQTEQEQALKRFNQIKAEAEELREEKRKLRGPRRKIVYQSPKPSKTKPITHKKVDVPVTKVEEIDYDAIYKPWMVHVKSKSTSKSYWYIHEYIGRYILNFAINNNAKSISTEIVQAFLDDYGQGKAAKTMNHYNRVAKYFLEFCQKL